MPPNFSNRSAIRFMIFRSAAVSPEGRKRYQRASCSLSAFSTSSSAENPFIREPLLAAQTAEDVLTALDLAGQYWRNRLGPGTIPYLILAILRDPRFPKKRRTQQVNFLADSLAAWGRVSPRRSRDICEQERRKDKKAHHIIRHEYYIECSCGYKGPAKNDAYRKCGAEISAVSFVSNPFE
jgi:hypothetical protein